MNKIKFRNRLSMGISTPTGFGIFMKKNSKARNPNWFGFRKAVFEEMQNVLRNSDRNPRMPLKN